MLWEERMDRAHGGDARSFRWVRETTHLFYQRCQRRAAAVEAARRLLGGYDGKFTSDQTVEAFAVPDINGVSCEVRGRSPDPFGSSCALALIVDSRKLETT